MNGEGAPKDAHADSAAKLESKPKRSTASEVSSLDRSIVHAAVLELTRGFATAEAASGLGDPYQRRSAFRRLDVAVAEASRLLLEVAS